jgi:hypothetical protein
MKPLIVILVVSALVFGLAKPMALLFSTENDFSRRRNVWFALTIIAFLSPNFWLFAVVAVPLLAWAGRKDSNPVALYVLLLHVIPPIPVEIPGPGIEVFDLNNYRLLCFCVLIPTAIALRRSKDRPRGMTAMDVLLLAYGALQIVLFIPPDLPSHIILPDSPTNVLRRAFLFFIDVYVLYFVVSRGCRTQHAIKEVLAAFCLSSAVMAAVALFEFVRHWLLYVDLAAGWGSNPRATFYLMRGNYLRAQVTAGHPLLLGYLLAIAFGFWLYLQLHIKRQNGEPATQLLTGRLRPLGYPLVMAFGIWRYIQSFIQKRKLIPLTLFWLGLLAAYSRGPWIGALVIYLAFVALGRRALSGLLKASVILGVLGVALAVSPIGKQIMSTLPFFGGSVDIGNLDYRQRLAQRAWELIQQNPLFGDQLASTRLQDLRQGEGIIDLVNSYAEIGLHYGLIGLSLFIGVIVVGLFKTYLFARVNMLREPELASLGACLCACILGTLFMMASISFGLGLEKMYYVLAGLAAAYSALETQKA